MSRFKSIFTLCILISAVTVFASGISVKPGTILIQEVPLGETYDFETRRGQKIVIGPVATDKTYALYAEPASTGGSEATGFFDFPEPNWFDLEMDTIDIATGEEGHVAMWMTIPDDEGLYNHHWLLGIPITPVVEPGTGEQIQIGVYLLYRIETEAKAGVVPSCARDEVVTAPSRMVFQDVLPGSESSEVIQLFQGRDKSLLFNVHPLDPTSPVAQLTILGTPGFPRLANPEWLEYPEEVVIPG